MGRSFGVQVATKRPEAGSISYKLTADAQPAGPAAYRGITQLVSCPSDSSHKATKAAITP